MRQTTAGNTGRVADFNALLFTVYVQWRFETAAFCFVLYYESAASDKRESFFVTSMSSQLGCLKMMVTMQATCSKLHSSQYRAIIRTPSTCLSLKKKSSVFSVRYELNSYIVSEIPDVIKFRHNVKGNTQFWYSNCSSYFFSCTIQHSSHFQLPPSVLKLYLAFGLL